MENLKISKEDEYLLENNNVCFDKSTGYYRVKNHKHTRLHRVIMNAKKGDIVDHINREKNDNRRENLRLVSKSLNNYNRDSKNPLGKGIYYDKCGDRYRACISLNNKTLKLGSSKDINVVKELYNKKALEIYGKDAYQHILNNMTSFVDMPHFEIKKDNLYP